ncbi:MAG: hypothetical protein WCF84_12295 [Anaerolineae bacterium]
MKPLAAIVVVICLAVLSLGIAVAAAPDAALSTSPGAPPVDAPGERLTNGHLEEGFTDGLGRGWHSFMAGNAVSAFYDDTWPAVVYDGAHSQLIEVNSFVTRTPSPTPTPHPVIHPKGLTYDPISHRVFVASRDTNTVEVLNEETLNRVHDPIPVGKQPFDVVLVGTQLFVANFVSSSVSVIDSITLARLPDIDISSCGGEASHIAADPTMNRVYVTLHASGRVAIVDAAARALVACVGVGVGTFGIAVDTDQHRVYVGNRDSNDLWMIDGATNDARQVYKFEQGGVRGSPYYVAFDTASGRLLVMGALPEPVANQLFVFQPTANGVTLVQQIKVGDTADGGWVMTSPCSGLIYIAASADNTLWVLNPDLTVNRVLSADTVGNDPFGLADNPALGYVYIGNRTPGDIRILREACVATAPTPGQSASPASVPFSTGGGIYQTVAVVQGSSYTLTLHGMMRVNPGDPDQNTDRIRIQWGIDPQGGNDWAAVTDWHTIPWNVQYLRLKAGPMLDYTTGIVAPSGKLTLFLRVWRSHYAPDLELDTNLDGLSLVGPVPAKTGAPVVQLDVPNGVLVNHSYLVRATASDATGIAQVSLSDNGIPVGTSAFATGPAEQVAEFAWTPGLVGTHVLTVTARNTAGVEVQASQTIVVSAPVEFLRNGNFEQGFGADGLANEWHTFNNSGAQVQYATRDETWPQAVLEGNHAQSLVLSTVGASGAPGDRITGLCQDVRGLAPGTDYTLALNGLIRLTEGAKRPDNWSYMVQWGSLPGADVNCAGWASVTEWHTIPWNTLYYKGSPGPYSSYTSTLTAPANQTTLYLRLWKKWPTDGLEVNLTLDALSLH